MKKIAFISFAAIAALVSCQREDFTNGPQTADSPVFTASIAADETKTTLSDDSQTAKILWESTDRITITDASSHKAVYKLSAGEGTASGTFVKESGDDLDSPGTYTATYGTAPANYQVYSASGSVPLYMTASAASNDLVFTAQCGVLRVTLTDATHKIMRVEVSDGTNTYKVTSTSAVDASPAKFYLALPAGTYTSLNIYDDSFQMVSKTGIELVVSTGHIKPAVSSSLSFTGCTTKGFKKNDTGSHAVVQLWADGPFWAENNIGADTPETYGQYFAWGYSAAYSWTGSAWSPSVTFDETGFPDYTEHTYADMAAANWGTGWSVPTAGELDILVNYDHSAKSAKSQDKCTVTYITDGVKGIRITGTTVGYTSNSIFLPAAGRGDGSASTKSETAGCYWSSVLDDPTSAYELFFGREGEESSGVNAREKYCGHPVRPVYASAGQGQNDDQPGGAQVGDVPLDALYGFGENVTGGTGADASHTFYFTSGKALQTWLLARKKAKDATPAMVYLTGTFNSDDGRSFSSAHPWFDVKDTKNISFIGLDGFTMDQIGFFCVRATNIVIRNVYIKMPKASNGADGISMQGCDGVWVDHCTFESLNQTSDYEDGSCDITHASTNVTVSWCKFLKTQKSCLVGHSSSASGDVAIKATFHHNWFSQSSSRHPRVRYGTCHVYNNLFDGCTTYGVGSACGAMVLVEHNVFDAVALPTDIATFPAKCVKGTWKSNLTDKVAGYLYAADNDYVNRPAQDANIQYDMYPITNTQYTTYGGTATTNYQYSDFKPSYSYTLDATANLRTILETGTGTKKLGFVTYPGGAIKNAGITEFDGTDDSGDQPGSDDPDDPGDSGDDDGSAHTYRIYYDGGVIQTRDGVSGASYFTSSTSKADFSKDYSASSYTVEGVSYSYGLKFDSKGYVTFTTSANYDSSVRFYFTARKTGTTAKIQLIDTAAASDADPVATFSADWGTVCGSGEVALSRSKTYTLKQISTEQGLIVAIVTEKNNNQ